MTHDDVERRHTGSDRDERLVPLSFRPPVRADGNGIVVDIADDERELIRRLLDELRELITPADGNTPADGAVAARLWPTVYRDDPELDAEFQRFVGDELHASRLGAIDLVHDTLANSSPTFDETGANAFMRALNTVRLVLGTMLGVTEDDDEPEDTPEYQLYAYLSWLLEWTVRAL